MSDYRVYRRNPGVVSIDVRHPSGRGTRGVDFTQPVSADVAACGIRRLNEALARWQVEPLDVETVAAEVMAL